MSRIYQLLRRPVASRYYLPEVDGIRFLAITLVVVHHIRTQLDNQWLKQYQLEQAPYWLSVVSTNGYNGVRIFFVLSGFILSLPFVRWHTKQEAPVTLGGYYKRRFFRLEPPYLIALSLALVWQVLRGRLPLPEALPHYFASAFYLHNLLYDGMPVINGTTWSLEIELQFYLLAPLLFSVFRLGKAVRRSLLAAATVLLLLLHQYYWPARFSLYHFLPLFLTGMLVADFYVNGWPESLQRRWLVLLILPALYLAVRTPGDHTFRSGLLLCGGISGCFILIFTQPLLRRVFSLRWLTVAGGMCYSIYLVHYPLLQFISRYYKHFFFGGNYPAAFVACSLFSLAIVLAGSAAFYLLAEKPFMNRHKPALPGG